MSSPSSAPHATARKGHTKARVYTPPLPENCDTDRIDGCLCGCGLNPDTSWGFECIAFLENVLRWVLIPYQKWLYIHALEKNLAGTGFRFQTLIVLIARQNGKTQWLKGLGLWKLYMDGAEQVLITAQNLDLAEKTLSEAVADVKSNRLLRREYRRYSQTNGKHRMILKSVNDWRRAQGLEPLGLAGAENPREWRTTPATRKGGRSLSVDLAMLDELREHQNWLAWNAITPTTQARPRSLVVGASNAGDATSVVLRSLRDGATAKIQVGETARTKIGLFEYSVPDDVEFDDPEFWPMANPAMGYLPDFDEERLYGKLEEAEPDNIAGFKTEYLCMWVSALQPGVLPAADWRETTDKNSRRRADADVWASVDVNYERTKSYVGVTAERGDGNWHNELVAAARGTDWVLPWFLDPKRLIEDETGPIIGADGKKYRSRFKGVVIQARGAPASGQIETLQKAGIPVVELGGPDLTKAYGDYYDLLTQHRVKHRPSPALDEAAAVAQAKSLGDAWVMDRKKNDCSAAVCIVQATWGAMKTPEPVQESAYSSGDLAIL
ncbi:hypothetical protein [Mycolicibacterium fluoranthenivorans]|uniref:Phage terminase-like protein, large subunit, contains N-terminal HTH domain n=1 Tax=Mycolicibacterium fluoranthenivorans TaxID=258505 RepID=A0A1G4VF97_9MYCO|nr:hypothetical protein [Mycolicibacterium fluoranthenivorans]SCX05933.1 Phage terminase-like protein, large subunit, contains N-terminal HTH domain [Mycolicibacterium fluoranthenivorans]